MRKTVLILCEESQAICKAFRELGVKAYSVDIKKSSGGMPRWHIQKDAEALLEMLLRNKAVMTKTENGIPVYIAENEVGLLIMHPPCQWLTGANNPSFSQKLHTPAEIEANKKKREAAQRFAESLLKKALKITTHVVLENPVGYLNRHIRIKPDKIQTIHPFQYGDPFKKRTCLFEWGVEPLAPTKIVEPLRSWTEAHRNPAQRAKTFPGIAKAIAVQYTDELKLRGERK